MTRRRSLPRASWLDGIVLVLLAGIAYASLARRGEMDCRGFAAALLRESPQISGVDALGNVFAYLLLGAALAFAWAHRRPRGSRPSWGTGFAVLIGCTLLSFSLETVQACMTERMSSGWDVLTNAIGGALGWFAAHAMRPAWTAVVGRGRAGSGHGRLLAAVLLAALAWLVSQTAPWGLGFDWSLVRANLGAIGAALGRDYLDPWPLAAHGAEWVALAGTLALAFGRPRHATGALVALAALLVAMRLLLAHPLAPAPELLATLPLGLLVALVVPWAGVRLRAALVLVAVGVAILAAQLEPGYGPPAPFRWRMMVLHGNAIDGIEAAAYYAWFAMTVVAAGHALGGRPLAWAVVATALLALLEWLQTGVPGRTPDLSPPLIALAVAALAVGMLGDARRRRTASP